MKFFQEFKKFAFKGNVVDMAVGVIIGGAFGAIVTSLVQDILMPLLGIITKGVNFADLKYVITEAVIVDGVVQQAENAILYGKFIQNIIYFLLVAISIFVAIRTVNKTREAIENRKKAEEAAPAEEPAAPPAPTTEELLAEIRDILSNQQK